MIDMKLFSYFRALDIFIYEIYNCTQIQFTQIQLTQNKLLDIYFIKKQKIPEDLPPSPPGIPYIRQKG